MRPGDLVDDFTLTDQTGTDRSLSALLADGPIVLFFYPAAMTGGCTAESCHFRDLTGSSRRSGHDRSVSAPTRSPSNASSTRRTRSDSRSCRTRTRRSPVSSESRVVSARYP